MLLGSGTAAVCSDAGSLPTVGRSVPTLGDCGSVTTAGMLTASTAVTIGVALEVVAAVAVLGRVWLFSAVSPLAGEAGVADSAHWRGMGFNDPQPPLLPGVPW